MQLSLLLAGLLILAGCGGAAAAGLSPAGPARIDPVGSYSVGDLSAAGLKITKQYDVSGLPGAASAWRGVFESKEYEARFYASYADVLAYGVIMADEVTGEDAYINKGEATWQEGYRDRKFCTEYPNTQCGAKYKDYVIRGNMILMCEGLDPGISHETCRNLLSRVQ